MDTVQYSLRVLMDCACELVMLGYIENIHIYGFDIDMSNRIVSATSISIFFDMSARPIFVLEGRFHISRQTGPVMMITKNLVTVKSIINRLNTGNERFDMHGICKLYSNSNFRY